MFSNQCVRLCLTMFKYCELVCGIFNKYSDLETQLFNIDLLNNEKKMVILVGMK